MANTSRGWRKYFKVANADGSLSPVGSTTGGSIPGYDRNSTADMRFSNYASRLPEIYSGHPNRIERYNQYENMDMDSEINSCLDILSEFSTQTLAGEIVPFNIVYHEQPTDNEVDIIKKQLQQWVKLNKLDQRIFKIFRNTLKYGDQVFVRDPETFILHWVDMTKVARVIVNESEGKRPEQYVIRDINPNFQNLTVAVKTTTDNQVSASGYTPAFNYQSPSAPAAGGTTRFSSGVGEYVIDAKHIVHLGLSEGLDYYWPFSMSILETVFRSFKQKELLEDSVLIYRVSRAPERRVFKIDVGNMPSHLAMAFVERVKNEIHQHRIPSTTGGGQNIMDSSYSPLSINEDYFFPQTADGRGSSVETLPGGCLAMDTGVILLDGRVLTIREIENEMQTGKQIWTYAVDPLSGRIVPGIVSWAGVTQQSAQVLQLTFDNGQTVVCTPDHKFPVHDKGFVRADQLVLNERMMGLDSDVQTVNDLLGKETTDLGTSSCVTLTDIQVLADAIEVGTLTIDQEEIYHSYHTFALSCGVFTKNSNLGEIDDLRYFSNKMIRGLRVPSSYLPTGPEDSERSYGDGRVGTALIQEYRFNQYCERLQKLVIQKLDDEFKMFMRWRGFNIDSGLFSVAFNPPQNFASYREAELDTTRVSTFNQLDNVQYLSKRFLLKRYLGLTEEEIRENEKLWNEERVDSAEGPAVAGNDLRSVGIAPSDFGSDLDTAAEMGELSDADIDLGGDSAGLGSLGDDLGQAPAPAAAPPAAP